MALDISIEIVMGAMMADLLPDRPFTMKELAERWQCTEHHVRNLALKREIEHFRLGKLYRFPQSAIRDFEEAAASPKEEDRAPKAESEKRFRGGIVKWPEKSSAKS